MPSVTTSDLSAHHDIVRPPPIFLAAHHLSEGQVLATAHQEANHGAGGCRILFHCIGRTPALYRRLPCQASATRRHGMLHDGLCIHHSQPPIMSWPAHFEHLSCKCAVFLTWLDISWQDLKSFFIWWFVYVPLFAGIPMLYVTYLVFDLWRKKALQQIVRCTCPMLNRWALLTGHSSRVL